MIKLNLIPLVNGDGGGSTIKNHWTATWKDRDFLISKSSFGWHIAEVTGEIYKQHVFGILFSTKTQAMQVVIDKA